MPAPSKTKNGKQRHWKGYLIISHTLFAISTLNVIANKFQTQHYFQQSPEGRQFLNKGISIKPITLKMFVQLTNVVLKNIDLNFAELTLSNYTELLPIHLDTLMYPGVVTASTLKTGIVFEK